jgi:hypothetical protein
MNAKFEKPQETNVSSSAPGQRRTFLGIYGQREDHFWAFLTGQKWGAANKRTKMEF